MWERLGHELQCHKVQRDPYIAQAQESKRIQLHDQTLADEEASKYLGLTLFNNLSWNKRVENVSAKGNMTLGFVKRNLRECSIPVKTASYTTLVRPALEYASSVWDPTTQPNIGPGTSPEESCQIRL